MTIDRKFIAQFLRELRRDLPLSKTKGGWTRGQWNAQLRSTAYRAGQNLALLQRLNGEHHE